MTLHRASPVFHLLASTTLLLVVACGSRPTASTAGGDEAPAGKPVKLANRTYATKIRRTSHGIPHILANDYDSLGYGFGYAFAQDNLCTLADELVTVNAERSRYFGPDALYIHHTLAYTTPNLKSDFFFQSIKDAGTVEKLLALPPPLGPSEQVRALVRGYAAGYNRYLRDTGVAALPDPRCRGAAWVRPITEMDLYRRYHQLSMLASSMVFLPGIVDAQPPAPTLGDAPLPAPVQIDPGALPTPERLSIGSNAVALGRDATRDGRGMLLGNPHFPWNGPERFYQVHLTIPGELNVSGASLFGAPVVLIGHNDRLAWSHTVSTAWRFTPFELRLVPGRPTAYIYEGEVREMTTQTVTVMARTADGTLEPRSHTFYRTHFGPVFVFPPANFAWTPATGYALRDVNANNLRVVDQFLAMDKARSVAELKLAQDTYQGIPWVNTIAADADGNAYYADASVIPHVTDVQITSCVVSPVALAVYQLARLPVLDGSRAECEWGSDPDAVVPGIIGPSRLPRLLRSDYVANSNDSHWLSNPAQPLTGYPRIIGPERTARSLRTRLALEMVQQRLAGTDGLEGRGYTLDHLQTIVFNNRNHSGELARDATVEMCQLTPLIPRPNGQLVDVSEACTVLADWNLRGDLGSGGAMLWREYTRRMLGAPGGPWVVPFNPEDPVNTPHTLNTANPGVSQALAMAVQYMRERQIPLDAPLGSVQHVARPEGEIPIHGCEHFEGCYNVMMAAIRPNGAYRVDGGSSFVMAVSFTDAGPVARSILTYSQSTNPASPYVSDQTWMFSAKQWVDMRFTEHQITADPNLSVTVLHE